MKTIINRFKLISKHEIDVINITDNVIKTTHDSSISSGLALIMSLHTTTGIFVNEGEPDVEADIKNQFEMLAPENFSYRHARFLATDGQMAINSVSHIKSALMGFQCFFPIEYNALVKGSRQNIYFVDFDGPQERNYVIQILGN